MAKKIAIALAVGLVVALAVMVWQQHLRVQEAREEAARLGALLELAEAATEVARLEAEARAEEAEAATEALARARAEWEVQAEALQAESVALADEIATLVPAEVVGTEVAAAVQAAVDRLQANHAAEVQGLRNLLQLSDETIETIRIEAEARAAEAFALRAQVAVLEQERDAWQAAAQPDFLARLKSNAGLLGGVTAVATLATLVLSK